MSNNPEGTESFDVFGYVQEMYRDIVVASGVRETASATSVPEIPEDTKREWNDLKKEIYEALALGTEYP